MKKGKYKNKSIDFSLIFLISFWCWFECRKRGLELYYSLFFSIMFVLPFFRLQKQISFYFLLYSAFSLLISSIVLTQLTFSLQVFFCFLHIELIQTILKKSPASILCIFAEFYAISLIESINHYILFLLMLNFIAVIGIHITLDYSILTPFNGFSSFLTSILSIFSSQTINVPLFLLFILFSLPRFPVPFTLNEINNENLKFFAVSIVSFSINLLTFFFGVKYHSSGQQSVSLMSMSNNLSLFFSVLANIESHNKPDSLFSYGYKRVKIVCGFSMSILLLFSSYNCISISMSYLMDMELTSRTKKELLILTIISCLIDIITSLSLRSIDPRNCNLIARKELIPLVINFTLSLAAIISTCFSYFFGINFLDPIVSFITAVVLFVISLPQFKHSFLILLEAVPRNTHIDKIVRNIPFISKPDVRIIKIGDRNGNIMTMNSQVDQGTDIGKILKIIEYRIQETIHDWTIEILPV